MKRFIIASVAVVGMLLVAGESSEAGGVQFSIGRSPYGGYGAFRGYGGPGCASQYPVYRRTYPVYNGSPRWHDTSHLDWHQGGWQRHGHHYDYVPGHYDYHQTGHWDH